MRLRSSVFLVCLFLASVANAATFTSKASGSAGASGQTTWNEVGVPGAGDRIEIRGHSITIDSATTIGSSPNVDLSGTGTVGTGGISSATLAGSGCAFTTQLNVGDIITIGSVQRIVTAIANDNSLTMSAVATLSAGQTFTYNNVAIYFSSTSSRLTLNAPLTIKGCVSTNYASTTAADVVTIAAGQGIEFDASNSPSTTATKYRWVTQGANNQAWAIKANGSSGSHCYIRSNSGGGNAWFDRAGTANGTNFDLSYVDVTRIGDATNSFHSPSMGGLANSKLILYHCLFSGCGQIDSATAINAGATIRITATRFESSAHATYSLQLPSNSNSGTAVLEKDGTTYTYTDKAVKFNGGQVNWTVTGTIFSVNPQTASGSTPSASWDDCWIHQTTDSVVMTGSVTNSVCHYGATTANPHWLSFQRTGSGTVNVTGNVFVYDGTSINGNHLVASTSATAVTYNIKNNLFLPNASGTGGGEPVTSDGNVTGVLFNIEHNTAWLGGNAYFMELSHLQTVVESPNRYASVKSNLCIGGTASASGYMAWNPDVTTLVDVIPPANIDKNARYLIRATDTTNAMTFTNQANGYASKFSSAMNLPGATDLNLDSSGGPKFVCASNGTPATSLLATWDASLGGAGTHASAWSNVAAGTAGYTPAAFLAYVRVQCAPRNVLLFKAGHDGGTIGAVELNFNFFFDRFIRRRTSNDVDQTPDWRDILDTSRRTRLRKAA